MNGNRHRLLMVIIMGNLLVVAVPQENGIVHGNGKLQDCRQRFGYVGNLSKEIVAAEVY